MSLLHHFLSLFVNTPDTRTEVNGSVNVTTPVAAYSTADHLHARITSPYTLKRHAELDADFSENL